MPVKKGNLPWNKGVTGYRAIGKKKGVCDNTGRTHFKKGCVPWNKGKNHPMSDETKKKIGKANKGKKYALGCKRTEKWKKERSEWMKKQSVEFFAKRLRRRPMSSLEVQFNELFTKNKLPYKFVGNGDFWIGRKNPDFINTNGQKIAIEVYYRRHKEQFAGGFERWKEDRVKCFREYGWETIFLEPTDLLSNLNYLKGGEI